MAWVRIDDQFYDSEKWDGAPAESVGLWVAAIAWCNRNDDRADAAEGIIPTFKLQSLVKVRNFKATVADMVARRALYEVDGGYQIHDYCEYQQTEKVRAIRDKRREAGRKGAAKRWGGDDGKPIANAIPDANGSACPVPGPVPVVTTGTSPVSRLTEMPDDDGRIRNDVSERWPACAQYLADHPDATAQELAQSVLGMSELEVFKLTREAG